MVSDWLNSMIGQFLIWLWQWVQALSFWIACAGGIVSLDLYAATKEKKYLQFLEVTFVIYVIIQMIGAQA